MRKLTSEQIVKMCEYYANAKTYVSYETVANAFYSFGVSKNNISKIFKDAIIHGTVSLDTANKMKQRAMLNQTLRGMTTYKTELYYNNLILKRKNLENENKTKRIKDEITYWSNMDEGYELDENGYSKEFIENKIYSLEQQLKK